MSISKKDVERIAHLARVELSEEEITQFEKELEGILGYVDQLQDLDVEGVEPLRTISGARDAFREDEHINDENRRPEGQGLIEQASRTQDGSIRTKGVFGEESIA